MPRLAILLLASLVMAEFAAKAQRAADPAPAPANRAVYLDKSGVIR